jgi:hypothetical protein
VKRRLLTGAGKAALLWAVLVAVFVALWSTFSARP